MSTILIIDDDADIRDVIAEKAEQLGHDTLEAGTLSSGAERLSSARVDLVFLDVRLPDGNGLKAISAVKNAASAPEVIIITGLGDEEGAALAVESGAWNYLQKPLSLAEITLQINRALQYREKRSETEPPSTPLKRDDIIGNSRRLKQVLEQVGQCAASEMNVLLTGETGTGKELFAYTLHRNSPRRKGPFVVVDCASLPDHLVESVLFGHTKGAFTGADQNRTGLVKQADGGTLFLDEVGELPLGIQKSFLRVLQERRFRPVGAHIEIKSDFRLVSATNRDLEFMVGKNRFRKDLLYRLQTAVIELPPLKARKEDISALARHYIQQICAHYEVPEKSCDPEFMDLLEAHDWPGNVRELINTVEHAVCANISSTMLYSADLPAKLRILYIRNVMQQKQSLAGEEKDPDLEILFSPDHLPTPLPPFRELRQAAVDAFERAYLFRLMLDVRNDIGQAMTLSGLSRTKLYTLLKQHAIDRSEIP